MIEAASGVRARALVAAQRRRQLFSAPVTQAPLLCPALRFLH
jgi:hypothetical protein